MQSMIFFKAELNFTVSLYMHVYLHICVVIVVVVLVAQSYPTLCDLMDYSPPDSSVHGILQARMLERVSIPFSNCLPHCQ